MAEYTSASTIQKDLQFLDTINHNASVYLVRNHATGQMLVGRRLNGEQAELYRQIREAEVPFIPRIVGVYQDSRDCFLELEEYVQGISLEEYLERQGPMGEPQAVQVVLQLCRALRGLHEHNIIHRDIKPGNVLITIRQEAYLIDFDISRTEKKSLDRDTRLMGTEGYAAPEQYGFMQTDCRADIYSLGVLLHRLVTGEFPGRGSTSPRLAAVISRCTAMDPAARYATVDALFEELGGKDAPTQPIEPPPSLPFWRRIPGFRRNNLIFETIAIVFYLAAALVLAVFIASALESFDNFIICSMFIGISLGWFFFIFDCFGLRSAIPAVQRHRNSRFYWVYCACAMLLWGFLFVLLMLAYSAAAHPVSG